MQIHIKSHPNYPIHETKKLMDHIKTSADLGAKCIVGTVWDDSMKEDEVKITLIATGFDIECGIEENDIEIKQEELPNNISLIQRINKWLSKYF